MCPARILADSRRDKVRGRIKTLIISISTKNGPKERGLPKGRKWATKCDIDRKTLLKIGARNSGRATPKINIGATVNDTRLGDNPKKFALKIIRKILWNGLDTKPIAINLPNKRGQKGTIGESNVENRSDIKIIAWRHKVGRNYGKIITIIKSLNIFFHLKWNSLLNLDLTYG